MLKSPSHMYYDSYSNAPYRMPMSDEEVEGYILACFNTSSRKDSATAPASEWLQLLDNFNEHDNHYMLTEVQKSAIRPYCEMNQDLEMTPEEFISLIYLIRHDQQQYDTPITPHISASTPTSQSRPPSNMRAKALLDARPRSSKILSNNRSYSYHDNRTSINHPDSITKFSYSDRVHRSDFMDEQNNEYDNRLKKERNALKRQLREYDIRLTNVAKEHSERCLQFQSSIEHLQIELEQQKQIIAEQKHKEKDRLEKITELTTLVEDLETQNEIANKKMQKKNDEIEKLRGELVSMEETQRAIGVKLSVVESDLFQAREIMRNHEKEKAELHMKMEQDIQKTNDLKRELEAQQHENTKLLELIDRQKFDLDEARSGLRVYSNTPIHEKKLSQEEAEDLSLAQEQIEAKYLKKLQSIQEERDQFLEELKIAEAELSKADEALMKERNALEAQKEQISQLSSKFDQQLKLVNKIQSSVSIVNHCGKWFTTLSIIPWLFFLFHVYLIALQFFVPNNTQFQQIYILQNLEEWLYKYAL